jgi:hypothetical protein
MVVELWVKLWAAWAVKVVTQVQETQEMDLKMAAAENRKNLKKTNYSKTDTHF